MSRTIVGALAFVGGVGAGLLIAKLYARYKVESGVSSALNAVGLGGGKLEEYATAFAGSLV